MSAPAFPRHHGGTLRAVDERLFVGGMGAILTPPPGVTWSGWVDLVEDPVRREAPALAARRDEAAQGLRRDALFRTSVRDLAPLPGRVFERALGVYRATTGPVLISCGAGVSRSASVAYAILRRAQALGHAEAVRRVTVEGWRLDGSEPLTSARAWAEGL